MTTSDAAPAPCEEIVDALDALAVDALEPGERDATLAHVQLCAGCAVRLAELRDAAAHLALVAPPESVDATRCGAIRARLVARAEGDLALRRSGPPGPEEADATTASAAVTASAPLASGARYTLAVVVALVVVGALLAILLLVRLP